MDRRSFLGGILAAGTVKVVSKAEPTSEPTLSVNNHPCHYCNSPSVLVVPKSYPNDEEKELQLCEKCYDIFRAGEMTGSKNKQENYTVMNPFACKRCGNLEGYRYSSFQESGLCVWCDWTVNKRLKI
jgi:hypothetical protein